MDAAMRYVRQSAQTKQSAPKWSALAQLADLKDRQVEQLIEAMRTKWHSRSRRWASGVRVVVEGLERGQQDAIMRAVAELGGYGRLRRGKPRDLAAEVGRHLERVEGLQQKGAKRVMEVLDRVLVGMKTGRVSPVGRRYVSLNSARVAVTPEEANTLVMRGQVHMYGTGVMEAAAGEAEQWAVVLPEAREDVVELEEVAQYEGEVVGVGEVGVIRLEMEEGTVEEEVAVGRLKAAGADFVGAKVEYRVYEAGEVVASRIVRTGPGREEATQNLNWNLTLGLQELDGDDRG